MYRTGQSRANKNYAALRTHVAVRATKISMSEVALVKVTSSCSVIRPRDLHKYMFGDCAELAYELHRQAGLPVYEAKGADGQTRHWCVLTASGGCLDIRGLSSQQSMIDHCYEVFKNYGMTLPASIEKRSSDKPMEGSYLRRTPEIARELCNDASL